MAPLRRHRCGGVAAMAPLRRRYCDGTAAKVPRELTLVEVFRPVTSLAALKVNSRSTLVGVRWAPTVVWVPSAWVPAARVPVIWTSVV